MASHSSALDDMNRMEQPRSGIGLLPDQSHRRELAKTLTGIGGLDEITCGGLPKGRPTLVCGGPGSGKTLLALHIPEEQDRHAVA